MPSPTVAVETERMVFPATRAAWRAVTVVEILDREAEGVIEYGVGEVRQFFHRVDERV